MKKPHSILIPSFMLGLLISQANAVTIVDSLSTASNPGFDIQSGERAAQQFSTTSDGYILTGLRVVGFTVQTNQTLSFAVYTNSASKPATRISTLYDGTTGGAGFHTQLTDTIASIVLITTLTLQPNTRYWIVLENDSGTTIGWNIGSGINSGAGFETAALSSPGLTGSTWTTNSSPYGMRLDAIPEPSTSWLLAATVVLALRRTRSRPHLK